MTRATEMQAALAAAPGERTNKAGRPVRSNKVWREAAESAVALALELTAESARNAEAATRYMAERDAERRISAERASAAAGFESRLATWHSALTLCDTQRRNLAESRYQSARNFGERMGAFLATGDAAFLDSAMAAVSQLEIDAGERDKAARDAEARAERLACNAAGYESRISELGEETGRLADRVATYREQRDAEGARAFAAEQSAATLGARVLAANGEAAAYRGAWDRLARELGGMTLSQLPADSYGISVASALLAGKRDIAESIA